MTSKQNECLKTYYTMLFPSELKKDEYVRLILLRKNEIGKVIITHVEYVKNFNEYVEIINRYKYKYDVYNQLATVKTKDNGKEENQLNRNVLFLDFDKKDYPDIKDAKDLIEMVKDKIPKLFIHTCINSGNGYHMYIAIKNSKIDDILEVNKKLIEVLGADFKAGIPTQIARVPTSYNHKMYGENGECDYNYGNVKDCKFVTTVFNTCDDMSFRRLDLEYIKRLISGYDKKEKNKTLLKKEWKYDELSKRPYQLCTHKILNEGADKGQRNFWLGRIVKMLQMSGYYESKIIQNCKEYNRKCRPPKSENEIEADVKSFMSKDYHLLGCYEAIEDETKRKWVEEQCDKAHCGTYMQGGRKLSIEKGESARLNNKVITDKEMKKCDGNIYLILTLLYAYRNSFGRRGFKVKNLKDLLYSSIRQKMCISERLLKQLLNELQKKNWIEIIEGNKFDNYKLKLVRKLVDFQQGYIDFYFSVANALINGCISKTDYQVYLVLVRNLQDKLSVTYNDLARILNMDVANISRSIKKLQNERCLIVEKCYTDRGFEYNRYNFISPDSQYNENKRTDDNDYNNDNKVKVKLVI